MSPLLPLFPLLLLSLTSSLSPEYSPQYSYIEWSGPSGVRTLMIEKEDTSLPIIDINEKVNEDNEDPNTSFTSGITSLSSLLDPITPPDELSTDSDGQSFQEIIVGKGISLTGKSISDLTSKLKSFLKKSLVKIRNFDTSKIDLTKSKILITSLIDSMKEYIKEISEWIEEKDILKIIKERFNDDEDEEDIDMEELKRKMGGFMKEEEKEEKEEERKGWRDKFKRSDKII
ncbi:hypothetical protein TrVE_jg1239 [Triparma verrucosa]|uniref:Uncharacterized protein n=1 Tax=Triparma verrucosa TaxID=1606542 RepID=A0A9W7KRU4_9STRA|nr:hypothetical protein TrVE_jg1239 [Triparma verrucosa]